MGINMKMYNELSYLRGKLKYQGKTTQGRAPLVCTDEALYQIKGDKRFNGLKYMNFYFRYKNSNSEDKNGEFLGL